jgi:hypothetical protein
MLNNWRKSCDQGVDLAGSEMLTLTSSPYSGSKLVTQTSWGRFDESVSAVIYKQSKIEASKMFIQWNTGFLLQMKNNDCVKNLISYVYVFILSLQPFLSIIKYS